MPVLRDGRGSLLAVLVCASMSAGATLDFSELPTGTRFGRSVGDNPGDVVYTSLDGIQLSVHTFFFSLTNYSAFVDGEVGGRFAPYFPTTPLSLDNLNVRFDFTQVGFNVDRVTLQYVEAGGGINFSVNDELIIEVDTLSDLPMVPDPGFTAETQLLDPASGRSLLTVTGDIESLLIGGQELGINTIIAVPEPACLALAGVGFAAIVAVRVRSRRRLGKVPR